MVYYRTYRPQKISDLDSEAVRRVLHSVLLSAAPTFIQVPHAFLFTGPKGLGKTSTARILAKIVNCTGRKDTTGKDIEPCNTCESCLSITNGTNMDVFEIDAASNRGIDEIRDLKEKIRLAPVSAKKKVYIIDEVHMLTTEAFNALLKTLEEPPSHAIFILCTTESHKVPATILSRCFHIAFKRATDEELVRAFKRIVSSEKLKVSDKILLEIAKLADGGFRDGTKVLEELVALSEGQEITEELFEKTYRVFSTPQKIRLLIKACEEKDLKASFQIVSSLENEGADVAYFLTECISVLHNEMLRKIGVEVTTQEVDFTSLRISEIKQLLELFTKAGSEMKFSVVPSLPLELALVSWCQPTDITDVSLKIVKTVSKGETIKEEVTVGTLRKQVGDIVRERALKGESAETPTSAKQPPAKPSDVSILKFAAKGEHSQEWIDSFWKNLVAEMKPKNHMIAGVLNSCKLLSYDRQTLIIQAPSSFHKERLNEAKTFKDLLDVCEKLVGNPITIELELRG